MRRPCSTKKRRIREKGAAQKRKKRAPRAKVVINMDKVKVNDAPTSSTGKPMTTYAIRKAVYRAKSSLPKTPERFAKIVTGLMSNVTPNRKAALEAEGVSSPSTKKNLNAIMSTLKEIHDDMKDRTNIQRKRKKILLNILRKKLKTRK